MKELKEIEVFEEMKEKEEINQMMQKILDEI